MPILVKDDPEPTGKTIFVTTRWKVNARCARWWNNATPHKPIMAVYPKDSSPTDERVQYKPNTKLEVYQDAIKTDGGIEYLAIKGTYSKYKPYTLYVKKSDTKKIG